VQFLIEHGHCLPQIMDYTLAQMRGFLAACARREAAADARLISLIVLGSRGDARELEKTLDRLIDQSAQQS
jgi:hypothetical protein